MRQIAEQLGFAGGAVPGDAKFIGQSSMQLELTLRGIGIDFDFPEGLLGLANLGYAPADVYALARAVLEALRGTGGRRPVILIGHSMGGYGIAEAARILGRVGVGVDALLAFDPVWNPMWSRRGSERNCRPPMASVRNVRWVFNYMAGAPMDWSHIGLAGAEMLKGSDYEGVDADGNLLVSVYRGCSRPA